MSSMSVQLLSAFLVVLSLNAVTGQHVKDDPFLYGKFPDEFLWGVATSSYQIEGAWNVSGKGENIWDTFTHAGNNVKNNDTGDVACDSYHKYKEDVQLVKNMGVNFYRFSISWSRIFPTGRKESYNADGMQYYKNLTAELKANDITPMATLYHWDLPQGLEDVGGWLNDSIIEHFNDYADRVFQELGDDVKLWLTFNEPWVVCVLGFQYGNHAPGKTSAPGVEPYICGHNIIKSHAKAWHTYNNTYRSTQQGEISITLNSDWKEPKTNSSADTAAAERAQQFMLGWFAHPIYVNGDYPQVMTDFVKQKSDEENITSRLPEFTDDEKAEIKGTNDFFGLNHYTTQIIADQVNSATPASFDRDQNVESTTDPSWVGSGSFWLFSVPWGLRNMLNWIKNEYGNPPLYITENGVSDHNGTLQDQHRIEFYELYINNVMKAINTDGCDVKGYTAWSLLDNFEWAEGYTEAFGMHYVDFTDLERRRTPKDSAKWYANLIIDNGWTQPPATEPSTSTSPEDATPEVVRPEDAFQDGTPNAAAAAIPSGFLLIFAAILKILY